MLITGIEKQKKDRKRYNIYLDGGFFCGLYDDTILKFSLAANNEVSAEKIEEIRLFDEYIYGKKVAFDFLSYRNRSVAEIRKKLKLKKLTDTTIGRVTSHLQSMGLLNDAEFARQLVTEKIKHKPIGKKLLMKKLFEKGVPKETGEQVLEKVFSEVDEKELALMNFRKFYRKVKDKDMYEQKRKVFGFLSRKGFDFDVVNEVIRENIY